MSRPPVTPPAPGEPHKNLTSLAAALGARGLSFSVPAFSAWKKRYDDFPPTLHEELFVEFIARHQLGSKGRPGNKSREELTNDKLRSEIRLNEIKIAKEERKLISADEVESFLLHAASKTKSALYQMVAECAPKCAGQEAGDVRTILRGGADGICRSMQTTVEDWQREQEEAKQAAAQALGEETL